MEISESNTAGLLGSRPSMHIWASCVAQRWWKGSLATSSLLDLRRRLAAEGVVFSSCPCVHDHTIPYRLCAGWDKYELVRFQRSIMSNIKPDHVIYGRISNSGGISYKPPSWISSHLQLSCSSG